MVYITLFFQELKEQNKLKTIIKNRARQSATLVCLALWFSALTAQPNTTKFGIQLKPIIPAEFIGTGPEVIETEDFSVRMTPKTGVNFGMIVRKGITKNLTFETGINLIQRNYELKFMHSLLPKSQLLRFRLIGYELPLQGVVYVRLGKKIYMNASGGFSIDFYPSNVQSFNFLRKDTNVFEYNQTTFRTRWVQLSLLANYGFEYRSEKSGYFYIGTTFHRPFEAIGVTEASLSVNSDTFKLEKNLSGTYLTADFRYYFMDKPEKHPNSPRLK